jgi:ligand-binding sensor domain-containing protein
VRTIGLLAAGLILGCGSPPDPIPPPPETFHTLATAPSSGTGLTSTAVEVGGDIQRLGLSQTGNLVVSTGDSTFEFLGGLLQKRTLYAAQGEQTSLGPVSAISPRLAGGAWLAAGNGLFELEGLYVTRSPLNVGQVAVSIDQPRGPMIGLWLGTDDGLVRRTSETQRFKLENIAPQVTQLAIEPSGKAAIAVIGGRTFVLRPKGESISAELPVLGMAPAHAVAASADTLYAATGNGLWRYSLSAETLPWTRLMLSAGGEAKQLEALATDPVSGVLWARAAGELLKIEGDQSTAYAVPAAMAGFTVDQLGDVWVPNGKQLLRLKAGSAMPTSFAGSLKPWLATNCTSCHADFAELGPFTMRAEAALLRVTTGDMPRCAGGTPCPSDQRLKDSAVLEQWIRSGKQP